MIEQVTRVARSKSSAVEITGLTDGSPSSRATGRWLSAATRVRGEERGLDLWREASFQGNETMQGWRFWGVCGDGIVRTRDRRGALYMCILEVRAVLTALDKCGHATIIRGKVENTTRYGWIRGTI
jgi:hypothetical protein